MALSSLWFWSETAPPQDTRTEVKDHLTGKTYLIDVPRVERCPTIDRQHAILWTFTERHDDGDDDNDYPMYYD